ncbi:MAG: metal ABC transporter substrate-binding protein [Agarilytica sp.]
MRSNSLFLLLFSTFVAFSLTSVPGFTSTGLAKKGRASEKPLSIVASIRPLALIAQEIAGDVAEVAVLVDGASSPHDFSLTIRQALKMQDADLLLKVGSGVDAFLDDLSVPMPVLALNEKAGAHVHDKKLKVGGGHHHHSHANTHPWLDVKQVLHFADKFQHELSALRPQDEADIALRHKRFRSMLEAAHAATKQALLAHSNTPFAVYHDAYSEWVAAYQLAQPYSLTKVPHERLSAKRLNTAGQIMAGASCLLVETASEQDALRIAKLFDIPMVSADILAQRSDIQSFTAFLQEIAKSFQRCFEA